MQVVKKVISPETAHQVSLPVAKASVVLNEVAGVPAVVATITEVDESASSVVAKVILPGECSILPLATILTFVTEIAHLLVVPVLPKAAGTVATGAVVVAKVEVRPAT